MHSHLRHAVSALRRAVTPALLSLCGLPPVLWPALAAAAAPAIPPIRKVVVYADRAEVTRRGPALCAEGKAELAFPGLPTAVDVRTLRSEATGRARAIGTTHRIVPLEQNRDARAAELEKERLALLDRRQQLTGAQQVLGERIADVAAYGSYFGTLAGEEARSERPDTARWERALEMMSREQLDGASRELELTRQLRAVDRQLELLERRIERLAPQRVAEALLVSVAVDCQGEQQPTVSLSYVVPGATWRPEYDLRFTASDRAKVGPGKAELTVAALVQQASGEDWEDVQLVLSTSRPKLGAEAPYPAPLFVHGSPAGKKKVLVDTLERREKLAGPAQASTAEPLAQAALEDRGQSFALVLPHRTTIRADGRPYWMPVDVRSTDAKAQLVTIPRLKPYVFQMARLHNPAPYPLLAGRIHSYRAGSYVGDTTLEYKGPGEPLEVSLGIDEELHVERKDVEKKERGPGLLGSTRHLERAHRIRLTSGAKVPLAVEVRESIPVSKTAEVKIELVGGETT
ncbi:MAG: mucoidy inhibitor MuiA family protein, partial [Deltaproteobacteria bacterium]|nr:mucoidy inhibitor MuiA family protein [Deltaproteobacteria bacterium]